MTSETRVREAAGLRTGAIGLREVLFQSITDMAPGAAVAASIPAGAAFAGGALPLSVLVALVACLLTAYCIGQLAKNIPAAGSLGTYVARGLHQSLGFLVAWAYVAIGVLIPPLVLLQLGFTTASTIHGEWSTYPANLWWPWTLAGALIVVAAGLYGVQASAVFGTILGVFEVLVFVVLGVLLIVHAGGHNTGRVFGTSYTPSAHHGLAGVIGGSVFTILAFGGFEGATPLAEEARDPRKTIPRAVIGAVLIVGIFYVFTTYAADVAFGPGRFATFSSSGPGSWLGITRILYGFVWWFVFAAIVNSTIANSNAGVNVASRTAFAMGRIGAFPRGFAFVSDRHRAPYVGILVTGVVTIAISLWLGFQYDPTTAFAIVGTALVIMLVSIYIVSNAACIGYFVRDRTAGFNPISHLLIPLLGIAAFFPAWLSAVGWNPFGWSFIGTLAAPLSYAVRGVVVWMIVGVVYLIYLYVTDRQRVADVARIHLDEEPLPEVEQV
ncbi:APC family permease [Jatrophihabitans endophyticus]|uniref:APC family permease n=1 Tax=Jatrophihabitans endophyticus TaxID=1206085 RepID=UPI001A0A8D48|nr:APC family permease [Jatrophihabitans endophyticus]MBE7189425.1 APC family permease [Jatrophihabitans endophyticus]